MRGLTIFSATLLIAGIGCATTVPAASSRYLAADAATAQSAPVCFAPVSAGPGLAARANADRLKELCESAARRQGVPVVPFESPSCAIAATMDWASKPTVEIVEDCTTVLGINCIGGVVDGQTLPVALNQKTTRQQKA